MTVPNILMIVTSSSRMGDTDKPTGLWAEELAAPYYALVDAGASVVIASTAGGRAPIDPGSLKPAGENDAIVERMDKAADPVAEGVRICVETIEQLSEIPQVSGVHIMAPNNDAAVPEVITEARNCIPRLAI